MSTRQIFLSTTATRVFGSSQTGKIAAKVINHYGDEVLKVYEIPRQKG